MLHAGVILWKRVKRSNMSIVLFHYNARGESILFGCKINFIKNVLYISCIVRRLQLFKVMKRLNFQYPCVHANRQGLITLGKGLMRNEIPAFSIRVFIYPLMYKCLSFSKVKRQLLTNKIFHKKVSMF